jgi:hypothetical protein
MIAATVRGPIPARVLEFMALARRHAQRRYGGDPNVLGVFIGPKIRRGQAGELSIQFAVRRKGERWCRGRRRLPGFVLGRRRDGSVDRRRRVPTDVLETGCFRAACGSGTAIEGPGSRGSIALLFRDKARRGGSFFPVTCAHVAAAMQGGAPPEARLEAECGGAGTGTLPRIQARLVAAAAPAGGRLEFDIALARVEGPSPPLRDLEVPAARVRLHGFSEDAAFGPVEVASATGSIQGGEVISGRGEIPIAFREGVFRLGNLWMLRGVRVAGGDSGGLVYRGDRALGILVGRSSAGFGLFHLLQDSIAHLLDRNPTISLKIFEGTKR